MKEKKQKAVLQANGRAYVAGVYLTPLQALGVVQQLSVSIPLYEGQLTRPSKEQEAYIDALKERLAAAEEVAQLRWEEKGDKKINKKVAS